MVKEEVLYDWKSDLKTKNIANLGKLKVDSKTIILLIGQSLAGKTASCLHFVDSAIKKKYNVLYADTDQKSILARPEPNLFKFFYNKNKDLYDKHFFYSRTNNLDSLFDEIDKRKPNLLIIDSVYTPYLIIDSPKQRAKEIKVFLSKLREKIWEHEIGVILTTPIGRVVGYGSDGDNKIALGGEGLKYACDVKIFIHFAKSEDKDEISGNKRFYVTDRQIRHGFIINDGGKIEGTNES